MNAVMMQGNVHAKSIGEAVPSTPPTALEIVAKRAHLLADRAGDECAKLADLCQKLGIPIPPIQADQPPAAPGLIGALGDAHERLSARLTDVDELIAQLRAYL